MEDRTQDCIDEPEKILDYCKKVKTLFHIVLSYKVAEIFTVQLIEHWWALFISIVDALDTCVF